MAELDSDAVERLSAKLYAVTMSEAEHDAATLAENALREERDRLLNAAEAVIRAWFHIPPTIGLVPAIDALAKLLANEYGLPTGGSVLAEEELMTVDLGQINLPAADIARIRGMVTAWVYSVDPRASIATAEEFTSIMVTSAEATGAAVADRLRPVLGMLQEVITASRTHADHDPVLQDALAAYDEARKAAEGG